MLTGNGRWMRSSRERRTTAEATARRRVAIAESCPVRGGRVSAGAVRPSTRTRTDGDETGLRAQELTPRKSHRRARMASATEIPACKERVIAPVLVNTGCPPVPGLISASYGWLCAISFMWKASMAAPDPAERANRTPGNEDDREE